MLNQHKCQIDKDTQQKCEICLVKKTAKLMKNMSHMLRKNSPCPFNVSTEELLEKYNFNTEESKTVRVELEKYFNTTTKKLKLKTQNLLILNFI